VLQIYLAEKIYDCLWWIKRYEAQKLMVMIAVMIEMVQDHYPAKGTIDTVELRDALFSEAVTAEMFEALQGMGCTIESLKQQAMTRKSREIRALDEQIALQAKMLAGFQASYEVAANRKLNIERMKLQNEMLRRDVEAIDVKQLDKKS
jgi:dephospho-CoA kinase